MDNRIEQALREIGSERQLSAAQRNRIRAAMIATARSRAQLRGTATSRSKLFTSRLLPAGFALASLASFVFAAYVLMGGAPRHPISWAESKDAYLVGQRHNGPFGLAWHVYVTAQPNTRMPIADRDIIYAPQPVVVTFSDESVSTIRPNTEVAVLTAPNGVELRSGQIDLAVRPMQSPAPTADAEADVLPRFRVTTRRADIVVRGTRFSVYSDDETDIVTTTEGLVHAVQRTRLGTTFKANVGIGEEISLRDDAVAPPVVQLHAPLARAIEPDGRIILDGTGTRESLIYLIGSAYPNGTLTAIGGVDGLMITTTVDTQGRFSVPITLPHNEGKYTFELTIRSPDGRSRSSQLAVVVDKTAPKLLVEIPEPTMNGSRVRLTGQTEPGATVTANGVVLAVEATGHFSGEIETPSDKLVQIVAQDPAGNESVLTQVIDR